MLHLVHSGFRGWVWLWDTAGARTRRVVHARQLAHRTPDGPPPHRTSHAPPTSGRLHAPPPPLSLSISLALSRSKILAQVWEFGTHLERRAVIESLLARERKLLGRREEEVVVPVQHETPRTPIRFEMYRVTSLTRKRTPLEPFQ